MRTWKAWTQAEDDRLEQLRLDGATAAECAAELGRTINSVRDRCARLRLPRGRGWLTPWLEAFIEGGSAKAAAKIRGLTEGAARYARTELEKLGYAVPRWRTTKSWTDADIYHLEEWLAGGVSPKEIAARLKRTRGAVYRKMYLLGIRGGDGKSAAKLERMPGRAERVASLAAKARHSVSLFGRTG